MLKLDLDLELLLLEKRWGRTGNSRQKSLRVPDRNSTESDAASCLATGKVSHHEERFVAWAVIDAVTFDTDQLSLVPPKYLSRMQEDLVQACSEAASLLAWLKEIKEVRGEENKRRYVETSL